MNKLCVMSLGALLVALPAGAQSAFNGTWKVDMNKVDFSKKPDVFLLQGGMYSCKTCTPAYTIKADGTDQKVTGHPYFDTVAVKVVSDHEIQETDKKGGKVVATSSDVVSADGKTLMFAFSDSSNTNGGPAVTGKGEATRVMKGPAGSHAVSGSWQMGKMDSLSENTITWSYKVAGDEVTMSSPTGQTYTAKVGGPDVPMKGDPGVSSVSLKMMGKNTLIETDKRDGKVISVMPLTLAADGKTAKGVGEDKLSGKSTSFSVVRQ